jgi:membrane dipeptidase
MHLRIKTLFVASCASLLLGGCATSVRSVHESLLTLDTHLDVPMLFAVPGWNITDRHSVNGDGSQVDLPRMIEGGLDGGFWVTYIPQGPLTPEGRAAARDAALRRVLEIREMVAANPTQFAIAQSADDAQRIAASGRRVVFLSMENSYPLGEDISLLRTFYSLGVRIAGPVHFLHNDLASSATDTRATPWRGLSPLGERWVELANQLGILIDASHASDAALDRMLELSRSPIILTHSGARAVFDHPRNVDDERLRRIAKQGGVIQVSAYNDYMIVNERDPRRDAAVGEVRRAASRSLVEREVGQKKLAAINQQYGYKRATFEDYMQHLLHIIKVAGVDHAGIGIDFDGGGGVSGLDEASDYPKISQRLLAAGYSREDLQKIWSGNALRVLREAQGRAESAQAPRTN